MDSSIEQHGKFGINIGEGRDLQIGDRIYHADPEVIKKIVREELRLPRIEYGDSVATGLRALLELLQDSDARNAVYSFQADFQAACEQIESISNYKGLHDLLHTLEFQCYNGILQESRNFPNDDNAIEILEDYNLTLQNIIIEIQDFIVKINSSPSELRWIKDLETAQEEVSLAIQSSEAKHLQKSIWLLNRLLAIQPSKINTFLTTAARTLRLPSLINALSNIARNLSDSGLDQIKVDQFVTGVEVLSTLNQRLTALVIGHDFWQEFDLELRRIESNLSSNDLLELEMSWPDLKERTEILFDSKPDRWTRFFQAEFESLSKALSEGNSPKAKSAFRKYRRRTSERFYQVDVTLKNLCEELKDVGKPLEAILGILK